jgi:hypothetical protein
MYITKTSVVNNWNQYAIEPTYKNNFGYNYAVECPILSYDLETTSGTAFSHSYVRIVGGTTPASARFEVRNDVTFSVLFRIRAYTMLLTQF